MTSLASDPSALSDQDLDTLLNDLEKEERVVSGRRTSLQGRIDFIRAGGSASATLHDDDLARLVDAERELSLRRHELHRHIDELHAERTRRRSR